ncbi:MarR family winged helix-turn-helix transcriptional regulator [Methanobacterium sp. ACI-7]|uniref:MarR family winged helix-turn-helix transcriptional regulator n=1 Tax=unclassified Methanobacterium TaxID=2627676 RepID=UPI0039C4137F
MHNAKKLLESEDSQISLGIMVSMIHRTHMIFVNDKIKHMDINAGQIPFLVVLSREEGITQDDLASHFHIDKGVVARALRKLEDNKYLFREIDSENRRRHRIYLTDKGKHTVPQIMAIDKEWEDSMCSEFSEEEYNHISSILKRMALNCLEKVDKNGEGK